jgi:predicted O-linked N-acetylglucosamine transferase (SPINDLY family)
MVELRQLIGQATQLHQSKRYAEAESLYTQALRLYPGNYPALHLMGLLRLQQNKLPDAIALMEQALEAQPIAPETLTNYGMALKAAGRYREALAVMDREASLRPANARSLNNRGTVLVKLGRVDEAIHAFRQAEALDRNNPEILTNLAFAFQALRRLEDAHDMFSRVVALKPRDVEAWNNRGNCLREMNMPAAALADFDQAHALASGNPGILLNRANTLMTMGKLDEALAWYDVLLKAHPNFAAARVARASVFERKHRLRHAIADLEDAKRLNSDYPYLSGRLLHLKVMTADWRDLAPAKKELDAAVAAGKRATEPFIYHGLSNSPADLQKCARIYTEHRFTSAPRLAAPQARKPGPIRVGYVSGEFHNHATTLLSIGLFENHDPSRFEIFAFDNGASDGSAVRARFEAAVPKIVPIAGVSDQKAAQLIAAAGIDILVNLNGYVGLHRTGIFALKPAPLQVNYLGFPGTMGAAYMDYILADKQLIQEDEQQFYDEKIAWLPDSYQINDDRRPIPEQTERTAHGLPDEAFVFCQLNAAYKTTPEIFAVWMRLLGELENSVLWLLADNHEYAGNLRRAAAAHGINANRLIFAPKLPHHEHVARLPLADLFLDTFPCSAHTIASEALWAGLPLLTCRGATFAGRVAASLLQAAALPEFIAHDLSDYESKALAFARDPELLKKLRSRLEQNRRSCALFDTRATTRQIESAFATMVARQQTGLAPESFHVPPLGESAQ